MKHLAPLFAAFLLLMLPLSITAQEAFPHRSELLPDRTYTITASRSISGNRAGADITPMVSTQTMIVETGSSIQGTIPVHFRVFQGQVSSANTEADVPLEWEFRFTIEHDGSISSITGKHNEGDAPESLARIMLFQYLEGPLFLSVHTLGDRAPQVRVTGSTTTGTGSVNVSYEIVQSASPEGDASMEGMAKHSDGVATYDPAARFYISRTKKEMTSMHVPADGSHQASMVHMVITSTYNAEVERKK